MKNEVKIINKKSYLINHHNNVNLYRIAKLITDYGDSSLSIQQSLSLKETGLTLGSMDYDIKENLVFIRPLYVDNSEECETILSLEIFKFIIDKWIELAKLNPDTITISEEDGQYSISAEFNAPLEPSNL